MAFAKTLQQEKDFTHEKFTGLRNNVSTARFELGDLDAALNIDLDDTGRAMRRSGFGTMITSSPCHSVGPSGFSRCFFVSGSTMYEVFQDLTTAQIVTGLTVNKPVSYFFSENRCYWSNGVEKGCIEVSGNRSWGLSVPPKLTATAVSGSLMVGKSDIPTARYQFVMTFLRNDGQESGAGPASYIDLPDSGGISFSNMPVSLDPTVDRKAIYISEPNGETLYRVMVLTNAVTSVVYSNRGRMTLPLSTQFLSEPPVGPILSLYGGTLLIAIGNRLYYSEPFAFELFDRLKYKVFESEIQIVYSANDGVHVGTKNEHIWLGGKSPEEFTYDVKSTYGAIKGTLDICDAKVFGKSETSSLMGIWAAEDGIVIGKDGGTLENLTNNKFLYPIQERGTGVLRRNNGINQFLVVMQGTEVAAPSFVA